MSTAAADKGFLRVRKVNDIPPIDAIQSTAKNKCGGLTLNYIGGEASTEGSPSGTAPFKYECYDFVGGTTPDATDYPDSIAPIGSTFCKLTISAGAVSAAAIYIKTAAATWSLLTPAATTGTVTAIKTANYTVLAGDDVIRCNTSGGAFTLTLPTGASVDANRKIIKLTTGGNILTIDGLAAETIDGAATNTELSATGDAIVIVSDGTNWVIESDISANDVSAIKTANYTSLAIDDIVRCNTSGGAFTLTLISAASVKIGQELLIKVTTGGNILTVDGDGSETIDGATTNTDLDKTGDYLRIVSDGTNWIVVGKGNAPDMTAIKTGAYTTLADDDVVRYNTSGGALTLTLISAASVTAGREVLVKLTTGGNILTIDGDGSETIDGATTYVGLSQTGDWVRIMSDGTNWIITGRSEVNDTPAVTTTYTAKVTDRLILAASAGGAFTITLPTAAAAVGRIITVKKTDADANAVTIDGDGAETIDGAANVATIDAQWDTITLMSNGTAWFNIAQTIA